MDLSLADQILLTIEGAAIILLQYPAVTLDQFDRGPSSGPDNVGPWRDRSANSHRAARPRGSLSLMAAGTGAPWNSVPLDARLEDADPEGDLYWAATSLFRHFDDIAGVGLAIASMLRLKRPTFFPILDRYCAGPTTC
jgi:hypothetical protein